MTKFITWFNASSDLPGALRAGLAHLYFECIHPFADGNGRIGRAVAEMALSQELGKPVMLSLSTTIASRRKEYYAALAQASNGGLDSLLNARQTLVLHRMLREGSRGFAGGINAGKYTKIAACSKATATRDLSDLFDKSCLKKCAGGGRSTRYEISFDD
jgi:Fic family protein